MKWYFIVGLLWNVRWIRRRLRSCWWLVKRPRNLRNRKELKNKVRSYLPNNHNRKLSIKIFITQRSEIKEERIFIWYCQSSKSWEQTYKKSWVFTGYFWVFLLECLSKIGWVNIEWVLERAGFGGRVGRKETKKDKFQRGKFYQPRYGDHEGPDLHEQRRVGEGGPEF